MARMGGVAVAQHAGGCLPGDGLFRVVLCAVSHDCGRGFAFWGDCHVSRVAPIFQIGGIATIAAVR